MAKASILGVRHSHSRFFRAFTHNRLPELGAADGAQTDQSRPLGCPALGQADPRRLLLWIKFAGGSRRVPGAPRRRLSYDDRVLIL